MARVVEARKDDTDNASNSRIMDQRTRHTTHCKIDNYLEYVKKSKRGQLRAMWESAIQNYRSATTLLRPKTDEQWITSERHADLADIYNSDDYFFQAVMNIFREELVDVDWQGKVFLMLMDELLQDLDRFVTDAATFAANPLVTSSESVDDKPAFAEIPVSPESHSLSSAAGPSEQSNTTPPDDISTRHVAPRAGSSQTAPDDSCESVMDTCDDEALDHSSAEDHIPDKDNCYGPRVWSLLPNMDAATFAANPLVTSSESVDDKPAVAEIPVSPESHSLSSAAGPSEQSNTTPPDDISTRHVAPRAGSSQTAPDGSCESVMDTSDDEALDHSSTEEHIPEVAACGASPPVTSSESVDDKPAVAEIPVSPESPSSSSAAGSEQSNTTPPDDISTRHVAPRAGSSKTAPGSSCVSRMDISGDEALDHSSDEDYIPDEEMVSDSESESLRSEIIDPLNMLQQLKARKEKSKLKPIDESLPDSTSEKEDANLATRSKINKKKSSKESASEKKSPDSTSDSILVMECDNSDSRKYDKLHYCPFCLKGFKLKLTRHMLSVHKEESEVQRCEMIKDQSERNAQFAYLRNLGNYLHNTDVIRNGKGTLVVAYRPQISTPYTDYVPCEYCLAFYVKSDLWKHVRRCNMATKKEPRKHSRVVESARMLLPSAPGVSEGVKEILCSLSHDEVSRVVKSDQLILKLANKLYKKQGHDRDQFSAMRNTLREVARLLINLRIESDQPSATLSNFICTTKFDLIVISALNVSGFNPTDHSMRTPSLALKIGHSLKKCAKLMKRDALSAGDKTETERCQNFIEMYEENWTDDVSTHALRQLGELKRNKVKLIPLTSDCALLTKHLKDVATKALAKLEALEDVKNSWRELIEATLTQVILFNRRRQGEVSKMKLEDFKQLHQTGQEDITGSLSPLEQKLSKILRRVEIVGKRGRTVPVLLTAHMTKCIEKSIETRTLAGVSPSNQFIFACSNRSSEGHIRGSDTLRDFSTSCGAKYPDLLKSTKLRKQIATLSQILNLKENELDILANFLGHDIRVHREFYRLPDETLQTARVSKLLIAMESGNFSTHQGKSLEEIVVNPEEEVELDAEQSEGEDVSDSEGEGEVEAANGGELVKKRGKCRQKRNHLQPSGQKNDPWTDQQRVAASQFFKLDVIRGKMPGKRQIEIAQEKEPCLRTRSWRNIKDFVRYQITSKKKAALF
ncbi:uncharacterized protein LOC135500969 [Lineus longissimus]|uniref:uncharacterized protein LOC135500969 n=1 Tax=Lineus longissimus TaxID=88925 RepID=UPI00315D9B83